MTWTQDNKELMAPEARPAGPSPMFRNAVCLAVEMRRLGVKRKVSAEAVETDADRTMIHVSKDIIDSDELRAITRYDGELRSYLAKRCLPSMFKGGIYLLPNRLIEQVDARLSEHAEGRAILVDAFLASYARHAAEATERLGSLFSASDYPEEAAVRASFGMKVQYVTFDTPEGLKAISRAIFDREKQKAEAQWTEALEACKLELRSAMAGLVEHMAERLTPGEDGKPRVFRDSLVANFADFLETFAARNIADDRDLAGLVDKARALVKGVAPKDLRSNEALRSALAGGLAKIKDALAPMVCAKVPRAYDFAETE